ncbi:MAG: TetR/AcrR family transcriptional regulator [Bifidobacteriaceae bacterium]|nr:TetR/AcrR family transcriptional regulator [Bifidobacteriaceae bacterium]
MPKGLTKKRDARLGAILDAATALFTGKGYEATTVDKILEAVQMGKGTFYHYFKSKEEVLATVVDRLIARAVERVAAIAANPDLDAIAKVRRAVRVVNIANSADGGIVQELHRPANRAMRQKSVGETIRQVAPVMARIVEQGVAEGVYSTPNPLATVEFLLAANQAILDVGGPEVPPERLAARAAEAVRITELALGVKAGAFAFLLHEEAR